MPKRIVPLDEAGVADLPLVGGKGAQLGAMMQAGLPVPEASAFPPRRSDAAWMRYCAST